MAAKITVIPSPSTGNTDPTPVVVLTPPSLQKDSTSIYLKTDALDGCDEVAESSSGERPHRGSATAALWPPSLPKPNTSSPRRNVAPVSAGRPFDILDLLGLGVCGGRRRLSE